MSQVPHSIHQQQYQSWFNQKSLPTKAHLQYLEHQAHISSFSSGLAFKVISSNLRKSVSTFSALQSRGRSVNTSLSLLTLLFSELMNPRKSLSLSRENLSVWSAFFSRQLSMYGNSQDTSHLSCHSQRYIYTSVASPTLLHSSLGLLSHRSN